MLILLFLFSIVNADLESNIRLYNSGLVSKSDVRFKFATQRHFYSDRIQIEMISNKSGLFKFSGANNTSGYMLTYVIHNIFGMVETKCNADCYLSLDEKLFLSNVELSWHVKTDTDWGLGSHKIVDGRVPWKYEMGERVIYAPDEETRTVPDVECSSPAFLMTSSNNVVNPEGKVIFSVSNSQLLLKGNMPECFVIQGKNNMNDTVNLVRLTIKQNNAWTNYDVSLMDTFAYNWIPVGIRNNDPNQDREGYTGSNVEDLRYLDFYFKHTRSSSIPQLQVGTVQNFLYQQTCSWWNEMTRKPTYSWYMTLPYGYVGTVDYNGKLAQFSIPGHCNCYTYIKPSIGAFGTSDTQLICKYGGTSNIACKGPPLWLPKPQTKVTIDTCAWPNNLWDVMYDKWVPNYSIEGIDDNTLGVFNGDHGHIRCETTTNSPCNLRYIPQSNLRIDRIEAMDTANNKSPRPTWIDVRAIMLGVGYGKKCDFQVSCVSRRIRPVKFFRGVKIKRSSSVWNLTVDVEDLTQKSEKVSNNLILKISESDEKTIQILGANSSMKFTSTSWGGNPIDNVFSMYEVNGEVP